jgi:CheY-like chemotaxis protein
MTDLHSNGKKSEDGLAGVRVLVVDDDAGVCSSLRDVLREENCEVYTATGGLEALQVFQEHPVDVVVSDVVMPDMDGYDLYMELKERSPSTPVVLMTAYYYDKDHVIKRSRLQGLESVIFKKPIDPKRLKAILQQATHRPAGGGHA